MMKKIGAWGSRLVLIFVVAAILIFLSIYFYPAITGNASSEMRIGPSSAEQACMMQCMGCSSPGVGCTGDSAQCMTQCNVQKPEQTSEEKCVETCVQRDCGEFDFSCQAGYQGKCDEECGMVKEPEAKSEEEQCIRDCIKIHEPDAECGASSEGETGNSACQMCAKQCEHLYSGPCLDEEKLEAKKTECQTCEHCYGEPVMGDSGEGWGDCIVNVECKDASSEFGDDPGAGEGVAAKVGETVGNIFGGIGDFFRNLFGGEPDSVEPVE